MTFKIGDRVVADTGHRGTVVRLTGSGFSLAVDFDEGTPSYIAVGNCFSATGEQAYPETGKARTIRLDAPTLDTSKTLQTVDGKRVSFIGRMEDGRLVVSVTYSSWGQGPATELRYPDGRKSNRVGVTSGDDVIVKVVEKITYRNVYADGTTGKTAHATAEDAAQRSKYKAVRIGILKQTYRDDVLFSAIITPATIPWYRGPDAPKGREATPTDYAL